MDGKMKRKEGRERGKQKDKMRQTLNIHQLVFSVVSAWTASALQFIFVLLTAVCSGKVKTRKIGYTPGILSPDTLHLPPITKEPHTTGTQPQPKIHQVERSSNTACICTAFVLHLPRICCPFGGSKGPERGDILLLCSLGDRAELLCLSRCVAELMTHPSPSGFSLCPSERKFIWNFSQTDKLIGILFSQLATVFKGKA